MHPSRTIGNDNNSVNNSKYRLSKSQKYHNSAACMVSCDCGRKFQYENQYIYHKRFQCGKSLQCNLCRRSYCSIYYVRRHMKTCKMKGKGNLTISANTQWTYKSTSLCMRSLRALLLVNCSISNLFILNCKCVMNCQSIKHCRHCERNK